MDGYSISQVAERTGFSPSALRFYEQHGLVRPERVRMIVTVLVAAATLLLLGAACSKTSDRQAEPSSQSTTSPLSALDPVAFAEVVDAADAVVVNVHVPYEGEIEGTDLFIPYEEIIDHPDLPANRETRLALYCRSGSMSEQAGNALIAAGYSNVTHLDGGMVAWEDAGREVRHVDGR